MHIKLFLVSIAPCTQRDIVLNPAIRPSLALLQVFFEGCSVDRKSGRACG
jgi:hypothetical protein